MSIYIAHLHKEREAL